VTENCPSIHSAVIFEFAQNFYVVSLRIPIYSHASYVGLLIESCWQPNAPVQCLTGVALVSVCKLLCNYNLLKRNISRMMLRLVDA